MENKEYLKELLIKHINGTLDQSGRRALFQSLQSGEQENDWKAVLGELSHLRNSDTSYTEEAWEPVIQNILQAPVLELNNIKQIPVKRIWRFPWVAAASILLIISLGTYFAFFNKTVKPVELANLETRFKNDINPEKGGATLTLTDGTIIQLDSAADGTLVKNTAEKIVKKDGQLLYAEADIPSYNTVATDKGKNYHLTLADGTQVWLDALSSIRFPTSFTGAERVVELTGQAYFEVVHNARKPFRVKVGRNIIEDLGTHFNVNAYLPELKTTLLEGAVKIGSVILKPGEQAVLTAGLQLSINNNIDIDEVMAWKNGKFHFGGNSMEEIFAQLSRWYDIEVDYSNKIPGTFVAKIDRDVPLSKLLQLFEMTKQVHFKIEGNKVTVMK